MMKILAADTSTETGSVAIVEDGQVIAELTLRSPRTHNRRILKAIDLLLREVRWTIDDIDGFAVTLGPGSFTGVRIGLTTVKTLAWAKDKPFVGIPTLDALAAPLSFTSEVVCALIDARKREVYCGIYRTDGRRCHLQGSYMVIPPEELTGLIQEPALFCGDGWLLYRRTLCDLLADRILMELPQFYHSIRAGVVGCMALEHIRKGKVQDPVGAVPIYVRPSEAELNSPGLRDMLGS